MGLTVVIVSLSLDKPILSRLKKQGMMDFRELLPPACAWQSWPK